MPAVRAQMTHACPECGNEFDRKYDLKRHSKLHDPNAKKFHCPEPDCNFSAHQKVNLTTHMHRHAGERPHACPDCDHTTADPSSLTRHRKRLHGYIPQPRRRSQPYSLSSRPRRRLPTPELEEDYSPSSSSSSSPSPPPTPPPATPPPVFNPDNVPVYTMTMPDNTAFSHPGSAPSSSLPWDFNLFNNVNLGIDELLCTAPKSASAAYNAEPSLADYNTLSSSSSSSVAQMPYAWDTYNSHGTGTGTSDFNYWANFPLDDATGLFDTQATIETETPELMYPHSSTFDPYYGYGQGYTQVGNGGRSNFDISALAAVVDEMAAPAPASPPPPYSGSWASSSETDVDYNNAQWSSGSLPVW
ncbi:hypothetical protein VKT23_013710 [Stygiomarasmius scandens]|uniref:C2H2-type domain-containing protein n=1 Tax=Marasmiellus scandens TaxID=2682957 RepID=A0ABR1J5N1_9AGAR